MNTHSNHYNYLSLNFASAQKSVFEYYPTDKEPETEFELIVRDLSREVKDQLIAHEYLNENGSIRNKKFYENISVVDQLCSERKSVCFDSTVDLADDDIFQVEWNIIIDRQRPDFFEDMKKKVAKKNCDSSTEEIRTDMYLFDKIVRDAFIKVLQDKTDDERRNILSDIHRKFEMYNNARYKGETVIQNLKRRNIDFFLAQEFDMEMYNIFKEQCDENGYSFVIDLSNDHPMSAIIVKNGINYTKIVPPIDNETSVMDESVFIQLEDGTIIANTHLTSKSRERAEGRPKNYQDQMTALIQYFETCPKFVLGGDFNHFPNVIPTNAAMFPYSTEQYTTNKTRTWVQPQTSKADKPAKTCADMFITSGNFDIEDGKEPRVCLVGDESSDHLPVDGVLLPNGKKTIGDHFGVLATIHV